MKRLKFSYDMILSFDSVIREHHFTVKCQPGDDERQKIISLNISVSPNDFTSKTVDSFGNRCIYGYMSGEHDRFMIHAEGLAECGLKDTAPGDEKPTGLYKYQTGLTKPGEGIRGFHNNILRKYKEQLNLRYAKSAEAEMGSNDCEGNVKDWAAFIMNELYGYMKYVPGSTTVTSTAEEAFEQGEGVCQDYAHIFLGLLRLDRIPCRYVVGFLKGEGRSHAWCEVLTKEGIYAFDPTNNVLVDDEHIKVSCGRDYEDCLINKGVFKGNAAQLGTISVVVEEVKA